MATKLDTLINRVADEQLRGELQVAADDLRRITDFGLVFEGHLPETLRLPHLKLRRSMKAAVRNDKGASLFRVVSIKGAKATVHQLRDENGILVSQEDMATHLVFELSDLIAVAEFGDPIYPGLLHLGRIDRGGDKPSHVVIKGENHHTLEALKFSHAGRIDCIYLDPPYNSGARDWKYNNDFVDAEDGWRHSKWLAFMQRRLKLAKELLNSDDSVLIVTIDEKEYLHLGMLLEQIFLGCQMQMVSTVINPKGSPRRGQFSRADEYIFFVFIGAAQVIGTNDDMLHTSDGPRTEVRWAGLRRNGANGRRAARPNLFYPIFFNKADGSLHSVGESLPLNADRDSVKVPKGTIAVFPLGNSSQEMTWGLQSETLRKNHAAGYVRFGTIETSRPQHVSAYYLPSGPIKDIETGAIKVTGREPGGAVIVQYEEARSLRPMSVWNKPSHSAGDHGATLLNALMPDRRFPFPKSLYAVEDTLRFFVKDKPDAVVLDFFAGSGTTAHAVARLNKQDGGHRQSIIVTNNEVSEEEARDLRKRGLQPGDPEWEELGIFEHITRPRITVSFTGQMIDGKPLAGDYHYTDVFPMADGFEENVDFFELTYLDPERVEVDLAFAGIAPLLWLRAGGRGTLIDERRDSSGRRKPYIWTDRYGVLFNVDRWRSFVSKLPETATTVYIVTDSYAEFAHIAGELPNHIEKVRLYERYLTTFAIDEK